METRDDNILIQYINGSLPDEEQKAVESWLAESPDNEKQLEHLYFVLQVTERLHVMESVDTDKALCNFKQNIRKQNRTVRVSHVFRVLQRIAAVLFIPLFLLSAYLFMQQDADRVRTLLVRTNPGVVSSFDLPDGSKVWLNAGSTLSYPSDFTADKRVVELNGQGYFEVTKNPHQPFVVRAGSGYSIEVLGTSFNVAAYEDDATIETTLVEGSVRLEAVGTGGVEIVRLMKPNEKAAYVKKTNRMEVSTVNTTYDTAWRNGEIIFRNHPMEQVLKVLSRHYRVRFDVQDEQILNSIITARFKDEQLPQVMEYIRLASHIKYVIKKPTQLKDGEMGECIVEISK